MMKNLSIDFWTYFTFNLFYIAEIIMPGFSFFHIGYNARPLGYYIISNGRIVIILLNAKHGDINKKDMSLNTTLELIDIDYPTN